MKERGLTLIELLVVIAIISILAVIGVASFSNIQGNARDAQRKADVDAIAKAYEITYNQASGNYRTLVDSDFASGRVPTDPRGIAYGGLLTGNSASFSICAALEANATSSCTAPSNTCFCLQGAQGNSAGSGSGSESGPLIAADDFDSAPAITSLPFNSPSINTVPFTTAADDPGFSCRYGQKHYNTAWYKYTPASSGTITVDTSGSSYDTVLAVYTGTRGSLASLGCNDDYPGISPRSKLSITVTAGTAYYVEAASYSSGGGSLKVNVNSP